MKSMIADFKGLGIRVRPSFAAKDILHAIKDHLECVVAKKKRPLRLLKEMIETFMATHAMMAYGI